MKTPEPSSDDHPPRPCPTHEEVREQLERILSSREFPSGGRGAAFLKYVTEEALAGRANRLKAYSVAIEVFHRSSGFTQDDPVVRIEAGRLRRVIERYYLIAGKHDPIRIDIPKGGYVPTFTWNDEPTGADGDAHVHPDDTSALFWRKFRWPAVAGLATAICIVGISYWASGLRQPVSSSPPTMGEPTLVVAPFADLGEGPQSLRYAAGLTEELLTALPRFKEIKVVGRGTTMAGATEGNAAPTHSDPGARFLLTGGVRVSGEYVRVTARLVDTSDGAIVWSQNYDDSLNGPKPFAIQSDLASKVATAVAQPYGMLAQSAASEPLTDDVGVHDCTVRFYAYRLELSQTAHAVVRDCMERAVARFPGDATIWAMLSILYLDEDRFKFNPKQGETPVMERALESARHAVALEADNTRALQALMNALFFNNQTREAFEVGEKALAINPNDTELLGEFGTRVAYSGDWVRGAELIDRAISLNPRGSGYLLGANALVACMLGDHAKAVALIRKADLKKFPLFHAVAAVVYSEAGLFAEAKREGEVFMKMRPGFLRNIVAENRKRNFQPKDSMRMIAALRRAGLPVPSDADVEAEFRISDASYGP